MGILETFNTRLKEAMKKKDAQQLAVLRMVKSRFQLKLSEKGVAGPLTDEMAQEVIGTYVKQQQKALPQFEQAGERGKEKLDQIRFEIEYLEQFLPKMLGEAQTEKLVADLIEKQGIAGANQIGRLMGAVMKEYKGQVDAALVKEIATRLLAG